MMPWLRSSSLVMLHATVHEVLVKHFCQTCVANYYNKISLHPAEFPARTSHNRHCNRKPGFVIKALHLSSPGALLGGHLNNFLVCGQALTAPNFINHGSRKVGGSHPLPFLTELLPLFFSDRHEKRIYLESLPMWQHQWCRRSTCTKNSILERLSSRNSIYSCCKTLLLATGLLYNWKQCGSIETIWRTSVQRPEHSMLCCWVANQIGWPGEEACINGVQVQACLWPSDCQKRVELNLARM